MARTPGKPKTPGKTKPPARTRELLMSIASLDPKGWKDIPAGFRIYTLWENPESGASIALFHCPKGAGVPTRHKHASNQFMYCLTGRYEYLSTGIVLEAGSFYMNPMGHAHGPTIAHEDSVLLEMYDGPHYFERPAYHSDDTVGRIAGAAKPKAAAKKKPVAKKAAGKKTAKPAAKKPAAPRASAKRAPARRIGAR